MARTAGRSADETRQLILTSAARLIGRHGTTVPVTDIAEAAGVSKGGLLYHFPNKETLLNGVATNLMTQFRSHVEQAATAEPEGVPGRLTRAYIRVSFAHAGDPSGLRDYIALIWVWVCQGAGVSGRRARRRRRPLVPVRVRW